MLLWDHGRPRADGTIASEQRPEADVNIEFQSATKFAERAMGLAFFFRDANEKYATDYPAAVGNHMVNTDSNVFMNITRYSPPVLTDSTAQHQQLVLELGEAHGRDRSCARH
jgi:hypothetical protein